jgi:hypothetical protein
MPSLVSTLGASTNLLNAGLSGVNTITNLAGAIREGYNSEGGIASAIRAVNLPAAGEAIGDVLSAVSSFSDANSNDWRVRLSLANWSSFRTSPVLKPLSDAGGLIFPYTPKISISNKANYSPLSPIHSDYTFQTYKNSEPGKITITAPMFVEDTTQGLYWIAMVHYLRSLTKMFVGNDPKAGNPPPIVKFNAYGNYVFKDVPVVVTDIQVNLDNGCDYIGVNVVGSAAGAVEGVTDSISGLASGLGGLANSIGGNTGSAIGGILGGVSTIAGGIGQVAALAGTFGLGGSISGGVTHVPTKSSFSVTLQPVYSRDSARKFSLDRFVQGGYLNNSFGYI